ncbi:MAG: bifunctional hydroxymethylpyrimidine kinase/phosphomethylpyrimidine kinase [Alphaproteobacteria bacterium]|nr:bifunctional hydroxymethylpyrimidine kinase/phosphomethylpyrimidine kinase [Alphaproteobacteria bacterium]
MHGRVLIVAGSDSGGGAGIQADIKTVTALDGYAATAITALTAQDTIGVHAIFPVDTNFIVQQIEVVLDDIGADCIKTGMRHSVEVIGRVADMLAEKASAIPVVVDPVMVAKGGTRLLEEDAVGAVIEHMIPGATLVTPNAPEAAALTGLEVTDPKSQRRAGDNLIEMGAQAALIKGGHLEGNEIRDLLVTAAGETVFTAPRIDTKNTHGTGCTFASAIATGIAQGMALDHAVDRAHKYVAAAIAAAPDIGSGHGPLNHAVHF